MKTKSCMYKRIQKIPVNFIDIGRGLRKNRKSQSATKEMKKKKFKLVSIFH